tara:strand:- start:387 stop:1112 length:726 start_codon:yes stop_codon:yes gene_type:complete
MTFSLIPAIDIIDGQLVRLYQGDYNQQTNYEQSPFDMALYYRSLGFTHIHVVDLNGAKEGSLVNLSVIETLANIEGLTIQVGGGVRTKAHLNSLISAGADAVIIGSLFVEKFEFANELATMFPHQVIAGLDVQDGQLATHGWTQQSKISITDMLSTLDSTPLRSIVTTDIYKDGTFDGLNLDLYQWMSLQTRHSIIASGGVSSIQDVLDLKQLQLANVSACIVGKAIIEGKISEDEIKQML